MAECCCGSIPCNFLLDRERESQIGTVFQNFSSSNEDGNSGAVVESCGRYLTVWQLQKTG